MRVNHAHGKVRCERPVKWPNRGIETIGAWEVRSASGNNLDTLEDCQITCWACHIATF
ncbi:MAG: hypothetical protein PHO26_06190 [Dehalococcoidia bacterium]|nr:hypothetical protein [Dehalococcoidia bacterium]MDD5494021.1 hypothetical protein [Dehalococcoidia bacterium]